MFIVLYFIQFFLFIEIVKLYDLNSQSKVKNNN